MDNNFNVDNKNASVSNNAGDTQADGKSGGEANGEGKKGRPLIVNILTSFIAIGLALQIPNCVGM